MHDTVDPDFASYVDARQGRWLRTAYLVYGELERAEEQLLHAFSRLSLRWNKVDDPDVFVQRLLYQPALARWSRVRAFPDEDDPVKLALAELTPAQRAVFVLLHLEELTEFEVADLLGISHSTVHGHALAALTRFRTALGAGDRL
ncbi:RNA polymerase sigma factor (sigma-70 family) [Kribbella antiqua]|uniref:RNA polymerase sigma factor (Sigma-70 family) n=1 Tax=Kribbella antiqua TaxID=2512217 RepID=A0A4R2IC19_9ACTN|nr:sigma factor-like helix-turn-helix DNA-binding protein [Kribbella antiqua]TCO40095.1 RNA polymerase sigma factor (sigma-70 family) [Kribbella antiqua]